MSGPVASREENSLCACGCGKPRRPGSKYYDYDRCRMRAYRTKVKAEMAAAGLPTSLSLQAAHPGNPSGSRNGDAQKPAHPPRTRRKPDLRISYRRAVDAVTEDLERDGVARARARRHAERILQPCLPPRLRDAA